MKVSFPTLEDLLREAKDPVRVVTIVKTRDAKTDKVNIPLSAFLVVVTAKLADSEIGEYVYQVGEDIYYFKDRIKELREKALEVEKTIKSQIESMGFKVLPGRYLPDSEKPILGNPPQSI